MNPLDILITVLAVATLWQLLQTTRCLRRRRRWRAASHGGRALACLTPLALIVLVGANLYTWQRFTAEQAVATIGVRELGAGHYLVTLEQAGTPGEARYRLRGDDWRLEARLLRWRALGTLLGLDTRFRLERLAGRYREIRAARTQPASVHALNGDAEQPLATAGGWLLAHLPLADARYGTAAYLPFADGARYRVTIGRDGLIARPANAAARSAVERRF